MRHDLTIAVTGLNATDNPGPGVSVLRSLRAEPRFRGQLLGLTYDTLDPGLYAHDLGLTASYLLPYPSQGIEALRERIRYLHAEHPIDVLIPTLDSELPSMIALEDELRALGIRTYLPTRGQFDLRSKVNLAALGQRAGIEVPASKVISDERELTKIHEEVSYPFMLKGLFYGAQLVRSLDEAVAAFRTTAAKWGLPIIVQKFHAGEEYDVVAVGDGAGGLVGAVPMKKLYVTDKGKGWAGVAVRDPNLLEITRRFVRETRWRGPCETEILRTEEGKYCLIEINPRFPAWTYLSAGAGQNLPYAVAQLAAGEALAPLPDFKAGTMFVRIAIDQIAQMSDFQQLAQTGELRLGPAPGAPEDLAAAAPPARLQASNTTSAAERAALALN
jgi:carbamoyl-phosphate synthase large subunit